jgi:inosine/xanthosine triphosphatase
MKLKVGSNNKTKIQAVEEAIKGCEIFMGAKVIPVSVEVEEYGHPKNLKSIVDGAIDRAKQAFQNCKYSFGIEGGLMEVPKSKTGFMEVAVCAIYDGKNLHLGLSPAYEWPKKVTDGIVNKGLDGSQALREAGITDHEKIGTEKGGVHILTHGTMDRTEYNKLSVVMALIHLENPEHF